MGTVLKGIILNFVISNGFAYNIDTKSAILLRRKRGEEDGLFGHSVTFSDDTVFVGAPNDETHGNVYKCPISERPSCEIIDCNYGKYYFQVFFLKCTIFQFAVYNAMTNPEDK